MTKKAKPEPRTIVVSNGRPQIKIRRHPESVQVMIPGFSRTSVGLAHAIAAEFLRTIDDRTWGRLDPPVITAGDRLETCTVIVINAEIDDDVMAIADILADLTIAARSMCSPIGGERTHDVTVEEAV